MGIKVLVTGARGYIGSALTHRLESFGVEWVPFHGNVCDPKDFESFEECSSVVHLAGKLRVESSLGAQMGLMGTNIIGTYNAARFAAQGNRSFFYASSCHYDPAEPVPNDESVQITHSSPYSFSKFSGETLIEGWRRYFDLTGAVFRIFNVYGPGQSKGFVIPDLLAQIASGEVSVMNLDDERDFVFIDDVARLMATAVMLPHEDLVTVNVGSGQTHSIGQVLDQMFALTGRTLPVNDRGLRSAIPHSQADISFARDFYQWTPRVSFDAGLASIVKQTFQQHPKEQNEYTSGFGKLLER
eukprot:TRINITY_DN10329_c0_g1_i1.p2 TRINITY_DN10329_c0_g1~~TRINITY_DN10329_c0_g1_i1.p2  ORF type:complete len:299 (+),score=23.36 TRINITY_DN10329_c0_g1_i1:728-1624(+)